MFVVQVCFEEQMVPKAHLVPQELLTLELNQGIQALMEHLGLLVLRLLRLLNGMV